MSQTTAKKGHEPVGQDLLDAYNQTRPRGPQPLICYAPFSNMYFAQAGDVRSCCFTWQEQQPDTYPQKSIRDIWTGGTFRTLRESIEHNHLPPPCRPCAAHLTSRNFSAVSARMFDEYPPNEKGLPRVMEFELANTCNLQCVMCSGRFSSAIRVKREGLPLRESPYDEEFVRQLEEFIPHLDQAKFYGGEPFLINIYYDIWRRITQIKPSVKILVHTNATILNNRVKDLLDKGSFDINISIDSLKKRNFERIRVGAKFRQVMDNLRYFYESSRKKGTFFGICPTPTRMSWHEVPELVRFCNNLDVPMFLNTVVQPPNLALWTLPAASLRKIHARLSEIDFPEGTRNQQDNRRCYRDFVTQIRAWEQEAQKREERRKGTGRRCGGKAAKQRLIKRVTRCIREDSRLAKLEKKMKLATCLCKIEHVWKGLADAHSAEIVLDKMDETPIERVVEGLAWSSAAELLDTASSVLHATYWKQHLDA